MNQFLNQLNARSPPADLMRRAQEKTPQPHAEEVLNAFLLTLWARGISYVRPVFGGMAASGSVSRSTPLAKML